MYGWCYVCVFAKNIPQLLDILSVGYSILLMFIGSSLFIILSDFSISY